ncbi:MAG: hypothetical protein J0I41_22760 [Filimonas sp.]|nr:hypothetical protein [Filimonas sp.]
MKLTRLTALFICVLLNKMLIAQYSLKKTDTLRFKSIGSPRDTLYQIRQKIKGNIYKQVTYYGLSDNSNISTATDTFIISKTGWKKLYNNDTLPFLSVKEFAANRKVNEYLSAESKEAFYYEYEPVKKINIQKKELYLYRVKPMSGKGIVEGLGDDVRYVIFDFSIGEIYRSSYQIKKVLAGYEKYVPYFKW